MTWQTAAEGHSRRCTIKLEERLRAAAVVLHTARLTDSMSDNVTVEAVKQAVSDGNTLQGMPSALTSDTLATNHADLAHWQQIMQAYYKQPQGQQPAFYPAAAHPYAGFFAGQVRCG